MAISRNEEFLLRKKDFLQSNSVDLVIFGFHETELRILLLQYRDKRWSLPGGFIFKDEHLDNAAKRVLEERTGLKKIFLKQFYTFGDPERSRINNRARQLEEQVEVDEYSDEIIQWFLGRFATTGYYALVEYTKVNPVPDYFAIRCDWCDVNSLPPLVADHSQIIKKALETLRQQIHYQPIGMNLLPKKFTMPEIQTLYETIIGTKLDRRNFLRRILSYKILVRLPEKRTGVAYKAPYLYSFDHKAYQLALKNGLTNVW
jgi:ADP-ribose pyrophosphatase YjhB (NUDIX family)